MEIWRFEKNISISEKKNLYVMFLFTILTVIISFFSGFIVEHDFIMATYLADRVIVFEGTPSINTKACAPQSLLTGMNKFLEQLQITFRRDPSNFRWVPIFSLTYFKVYNQI